MFRLSLALLMFCVGWAQDSLEFHSPQPGYGGTNVGRLSPEKQLIGLLRSNYKLIGRDGRPVLDMKRSVVVRFALGIIKMALNEKDNMLELSTWTRFTWEDDYLVWDPASFSNITTIRMNPVDIWIPDVMLYNTADVNLSARTALALVEYTGRVSWFPHVTYRSSCFIDVTHYPFDRQHCALYFGSWTYTSNEVDLQLAFSGGMDFSSFTSEHYSSAWQHEETSATRHVLPSSGQEPNFIVLELNVTMTRRRVFASYMLTLPCVFLAGLTLVVFSLPADRPDRTPLAMSIFSSFMLLLLILVEAAPPTASSVPNLGVYYLFNLVLIMCAIVLSSVVVNVSRGCNMGKQLPYWLYLFVCRFLAVFMLLGHRAPVRTQVTTPETKDIEVAEAGQSAPQPHESSVTHPEQTKLVTPQQTEIPTSKIRWELVELKRLIRQLVTKLPHEKQRRDRRDKSDCATVSEWEFMALVLDRLFFTVYLILIAVSLNCYFPRPN